MHPSVNGKRAFVSSGIPSSFNHPEEQANILSNNQAMGQIEGLKRVRQDFLWFLPCPCITDASHILLQFVRHDFPVRLLNQHPGRIT